MLDILLCRHVVTKTMVLSKCIKLTLCVVTLVVMWVCVTFWCLCAVKFTCVFSMISLLLVDILLPCCNQDHGTKKWYQTNLACAFNIGCMWGALVMWTHLLAGVTVTCYKMWKHDISWLLWSVCKFAMSLHCRNKVICVMFLVVSVWFFSAVKLFKKLVVNIWCYYASCAKLSMCNKGVCVKLLVVSVWFFSTVKLFKKLVVNI